MFLDCLSNCLICESSYDSDGDSVVDQCNVCNPEFKLAPGGNACQGK